MREVGLVDVVLAKQVFRFTVQQRMTGSCFV